jgi:hypothetical protein
MRSDDAYRNAWESADRNPDGSVVQSSLVDHIAATVDFDVAAAKRGLAQRIVARRKRPGSTAAAGAVVFPGMEHYAYEPDRLIADTDGNVVPNSQARLKHKIAQADRAAADAEKANARQARDQREANHFAAWADEQYATGRDPREITWDTCVRETGLFKDADTDVEAIEDLDDESEDR